ncbi:MAG: biotin--[acetyl-CoA-carboxylase] ligase [Solirubrobacteraceae bacterium]
MSALGSPRLHLRRTESTNTRARELAAAGAPHGTLVTAAEQTAGRGRQGRTWMAPAGRALLCSLVIRRPPALLPLAGGIAVAGVVGDDATIKWPNDVLLGDRKVAGILVEGRPQEGWAVLGIGINVALAEEDFPPDLRPSAGTLGLATGAIEPTLASLLAGLEHWLRASDDDVRDAFDSRDALRDREVSWNEGRGRAEGIDRLGRLRVRSAGGDVMTLSAGEVHLLAATPPLRRPRSGASGSGSAGDA